MDPFNSRYRRLAAGSVSNMYAIVETLSKAGRVLKP